MGTPKYNPPTKNSWNFSAVMFIAAILILLVNIFFTFDNVAVREGLRDAPFALSGVSAAWMLIATRMKGV